MEYLPVTHVLFDMDGLILNTEDLYTVAYQNILSKYGKVYTFELKVKLMGKQSQETAKMIIEELELPVSIEDFILQSQNEFQKIFPECSVLPGARQLIEHLHKHDIPMGLATSSSIESYNLKVNRHHSELFSLFKYKTLGSSEPEVKRGKPFPDIFLVAAKKFPDHPSPKQVLVFEDAVNGVISARAAGMQVVMVPDPRVEESLRKEATLVLNSLDDFQPELFGLPAFDS